MDKKDLTKAYAAAIFFSFLVGFSFLWIKLCIPYADSLHILAHRFDFALVTLILVLAFKIAKVDLKGKPKKNLLITAGCYVGFMFFQVIGMYFATSIEGAIIFAAIPIMVQIIAAVFLGEKTTWRHNVFVAVSACALIVMVILGSSDISVNPFGTVMLFLSSVCMALSNVFMRYVRNQYKPIEISTAIIIMGTVVFNVMFIIKGIFSGNEIGYFEPYKNVEYIIGMVYLGTGCILVSAQIIAYMQSKLQAAKASIFSNVSTAITIIAGALILGEPLREYHIICTAFIIAGVVGLNFFGNKGGKKNEVSVSDGK